MTPPSRCVGGPQRRIESGLSAERVQRPCLSQTMPHATIGPPSGPRLRQPYRAPKNAPVVAYHCGHIVRKPTPNTRTPPAQTKQNFEDHWNERKWDRGRGLELAQRLDWPAESWGAPQLATLPGAVTLGSGRALLWSNCCAAQSPMRGQDVEPASTEAADCKAFHPRLHLQVPRVAAARADALPTRALLRARRR